MAGSLLPSNATRVESALAEVSARVDALGGEVAFAWDPVRAPARFLEWLAVALSVDDWDPAWSLERKRAVILASVQVHRHKGTRGGVQRAIDAMGYGAVEIIEDRDLPRIGDAQALIGGAWSLGYDGPVTGGWFIGPDDAHWADYWINVLQPIPRTDAMRIADRLGNVAPVRCRLRAVSLTGTVYLIGDGQWFIGDDVAIGNVYPYEVM